MPFNVIGKIALKRVSGSSGRLAFNFLKWVIQFSFDLNSHLSVSVAKEPS